MSPPTLSVGPHPAQRTAVVAATFPTNPRQPAGEVASLVAPLMPMKEHPSPNRRRSCEVIESGWSSRLRVGNDSVCGAPAALPGPDAAKSADKRSSAWLRGTATPLGPARLLGPGCTNAGIGTQTGVICLRTAGSACLLTLSESRPGLEPRHPTFTGSLRQYAMCFCAIAVLGALCGCATCREGAAQNGRTAPEKTQDTPLTQKIAAFFEAFASNFSMHSP
jgi:hypothetical protein